MKHTVLCKIVLECKVPPPTVFTSTVCVCESVCGFFCTSGPLVRFLYLWIILLLCRPQIYTLKFLHSSIHFVIRYTDNLIRILFPTESPQRMNRLCIRSCTHPDVQVVSPERTDGILAVSLPMSTECLDNSG